MGIALPESLNSSSLFWIQLKERGWASLKVSSSLRVLGSWRLFESMTQGSGWAGLSCGIPLLQLMSNSATFWPYSSSTADLGSIANIFIL